MPDETTVSPINEDGFDYRQTTMTAEEYTAALFMDSVENAEVEEKEN